MPARSPLGTVLLTSMPTFTGPPLAYPDVLDGESRQVYPELFQPHGAGSTCRSRIAPPCGLFLAPHRGARRHAASGRRDGPHRVPPTGTRSMGIALPELGPAP